MKNPPKGALSLFLVAAIYGIYGVYARMIGQSFGVFSQNWIRNLIVVSIVIVLLFVLKKGIKPIRKSDVPWVFLWALSGSGVMLLLFVAFNNLPLGTVYFLFYSTMIIAGCLAGGFLYKEKLDFVKIISIILALIGLSVIYSLSISPDKILFVFYSLLAGLLVGLWNTLSKKFSENYPNLEIVLWDALATTIVAVIGSFLVREPIPSLMMATSWTWLIIYAITQVASVGLVVYGFKNIEAQIGSIILPVEVIFATIFGFLFFREVLSFSTLVGGLLIASAAVLPSLTFILNKDIFKRKGSENRPL